MTNESSAEADLERFIAPYAPEVATVARDALAWMRARLPGAVELVYDSYNALAISFGPTERTADAIFSIALYPEWVSLFFLQDATRLPDPDELLVGAGNKVRHVVLTRAADLERPAIVALMAAALERAPTAIDPSSAGRVVILAVSERQRPRQPSAQGTTSLTRATSLVRRP